MKGTPPFRLCKGCEEILPVDEEHFYRSGKGEGFSARCRNCRREQIQACKAAARERTKQYLLENPPPPETRFKPCPPRIEVPKQKGVAHVLFNVWRAA